MGSANDQGIIRAFKAYFRRGVVRHCCASLKQHGKIVMPNMKEANILIRKAWKMVSNQTIYNCWKNAGIIDCEEKAKEIDCLIEKKVTKYTYALDEQLKLINREDFFTRRSVEEAISKDEIVVLKDVNVNEALDSFENVKAFNESIFLN
jgi:hypothetical protein